MKSRRDCGGSNRYSRSLNRATRKEEMRKIIGENQSLLRRLQTGKSCYNVSQWNKDHLKHTRMLLNMCQYPYRLPGNAGSAHQLPQRNMSRGLTSSSYAAYYNTTTTGFKQGCTEDKTVLCKKKKMLGRKEYEVEIALCQGQIVLSAEDLEIAETIIVDVEPDKSLSYYLLHRQRNTGGVWE
eukprot:TRINITY_DN5581_c0_g1_i9.p1 TRINITY_DN5581_c0_g1~~TRINITY_DN5581_c0_g1_i9.p1  ORF type:complete len:182 (-),score=32.03 TRINITY_DN5581_c0_g1_i9:240-785(-)